MNREIDLAGGERNLDLLGEETFAANFGQQPVLDLIACCLDDLDLDVVVDQAMGLDSCLAYGRGLRQRQRRASRTHP